MHLIYIYIDCDTDIEIVAGQQHHQAAIGFLFYRGLQLARTALDLFSFASGFPLYISLDVFVDTTGAATRISQEQRGLAELCTAYSITHNFSEIFAAVLGEPRLFLVMRDLNVAISDPYQAPVACARAIEGIRNLISEAADRRIAWSLMNETLRLRDRYTRFVSEISRNPRHGRLMEIRSDYNEIIRRSWVVVNRYLEFRIRGSAEPLPLADFPFLE